MKKDIVRANSIIIAMNGLFILKERKKEFWHVDKCDTRAHTPIHSDRTLEPHILMTSPLTHKWPVVGGGVVEEDDLVSDHQTSFCGWEAR